MEMILKGQSREIEKMSLEQIKNILNVLEKKYFDSIDSTLEGNSEILKEIEIYRKQKKKLLEEKIKSNQMKKKTDTIVALDNKVSLDTVKMEASNNVVQGTAVIDSIKFNYTDEAWYVDFHENGRSLQEKYAYSKKEMDESKQFKKDKKQKFGNKYIKNIDVGCYLMLNHFDQTHSTDYSKKYLRTKPTYHIKYSFSKFFHRSSFSFIEKYSLLMNAKRQKTYKNAEVNSPRFISIAPFMLGITMILGILGINGQKESKTYDDKNQYHNEQNMNDDFTTTQSQEKVGSSSEQEKQLQEELSDLETKQNQKVENQNTIIPEETTQYLHDDYKLNELSLFDKVIDSNLSTNTSKLNCDYYRISLVSIVSDYKVLEIQDAQLLENQSLTDLEKKFQDKYGNDVSLYVNFNGYDKDGNLKYESIGWTDIEQICNCKQTNNQAKSEQLYQLRYQLTQKTNSMENQSYQKVKSF